MKAEVEYGQASGALLFQEYVRGGHHTRDRHCEGSTLKMAISRRKRNASDVGIAGYARKEVCHSAYCDNRAVVGNAIPWDSTDFFNRWVGMKIVVYNYVSGGNTYTTQELYLDRDVQDGSGNLNAQNNWVLITANNDTGGWQPNQSTFDSECGSCGYPIDRIITMAGGDTRSSSANYNRNLAAWRTDEFRWRWKYLTVRQIDPSRPASGEIPPPPDTDPASAFDSFGVRKVYPTKTGGNEWYAASTITSDSRFSGRPALTITKNSDNISYNVTIPSPYTLTYYVAQQNGYDPARTEAGAANHAQCANNGYMQDSADWRNFEMQVYVKVDLTAPNVNGEIILFGRGGDHKSPEPYCAGSSMKGYLMTNGETRFAKEQYHVFYNYTNTQNQVNQSIVGKWIGLKYVCYNRSVGGSGAVKQELYIDSNNNNTWAKIDENSDIDGWGSGGLQCKGNTADFRISWGGPLAGFRFDNIAELNFKWMSVREIDGNAIPVQPPDAQPPGSCGDAGGGGGQGPPIIPTDSFGVPKKYPDTHLANAPATWEMGIGTYASRIRQWTAGTGTGFQGTGVNTYFDSDQGTSNVRWIVYAGPAIDYTLSTASRQTLLNRGDVDDGVKRGGYMADGGTNGTKNWRDCEITTCLYLYDMGGDNDCGWFCRGGTHSGADGIGVSAEGSAYHPGLFYATGDSEIAKEQWHASYASGRTPDSKTVIGNCVGQWVWLKFIFRNLPASGAYASPYAAVPHIPVKIEMWAIRTGLTNPATLPNVSTAAYTNWVKVMEKTDTGGWGTVGGQNDCGPGPADTILSYGGPEVTFRADRDSSNTGYGHIRCCYTSVREIDPSGAVYW
jgi:hypothetical protein